MQVKILLFHFYRVDVVVTNSFKTNKNSTVKSYYRINNSQIYITYSPRNAVNFMRKKCSEISWRLSLKGAHQLKAPKLHISGFSHPSKRVVTYPSVVSFLHHYIYDGITKVYMTIN